MCLPHLGRLEALEKVITRGFSRYQCGVAARVVLGEGLKKYRSTCAIVEA